MYYAPIGLGCYFAALVGNLGTTIVVGYLKTFVIYTLVAIAFYFIIYTLYAFIAGGKKGIKVFWKNVLPSTLTALATCSSAASIPVNIECSKKMGVPNDIAETTIPLGTSFHKDGSIIGSVFKIMFLVCLFGTSLATAGDVLGVLGIALLANLLVTAVPIGGGTISEMLIITMMGYPVAALPILTIIATITYIKNKNKNTEVEQEQKTTQSQQVQQTEKGTKQSTREKLNETKKIGDIEISGIRIIENNGTATLTANVKNTAATTKKEFPLKIKLLNKTGEVIQTLGAYVGTIKSGETRGINASINMDISNIYDISIEM